MPIITGKALNSKQLKCLGLVPVLSLRILFDDPSFSTAALIALLILFGAVLMYNGHPDPNLGDVIFHGKNINWRQLLVCLASLFLTGATGEAFISASHGNHKIDALLCMISIFYGFATELNTCSQPSSLPLTEQVKTATEPIQGQDALV